MKTGFSLVGAPEWWKGIQDQEHHHRSPAVLPNPAPIQQDSPADISSPGAHQKRTLSRPCGVAKPGTNATRPLSGLPYRKDDAKTRNIPQNNFEVSKSQFRKLECQGQELRYIRSEGQKCVPCVPNINLEILICALINWSAAPVIKVIHTE